MKKITNKMKSTSAAVSSVVLATVLTATVSATQNAEGNPATAQNTLNSVAPTWGNFTLGSAIQILLNSVLAIVLFIALVMLIIGGIRYTTSSGNADAVKGAKNQILYAIIGIVIVVLSFAIVQFIYSILPTNPNP